MIPKRGHAHDATLAFTRFFLRRMGHIAQSAAAVLFLAAIAANAVGQDYSRCNPIDGLRRGKFRPRRSPAVFTKYGRRRGKSEVRRLLQNYFFPR